VPEWQRFHPASELPFCSVSTRGFSFRGVTVDHKVAVFSVPTPPIFLFADVIRYLIESTLRNADGDKSPIELHEAPMAREVLGEQNSAFLLVDQQTHRAVTASLLDRLEHRRKTILRSARPNLVVVSNILREEWKAHESDKPFRRRCIRTATV